MSISNFILAFDSWLEEVAHAVTVQYKLVQTNDVLVESKTTPPWPIPTSSRWTWLCLDTRRRVLAHHRVGVLKIPGLRTETRLNLCIREPEYCTDPSERGNHSRVLFGRKGDHPSRPGWRSHPSCCCGRMASLQFYSQPHQRCDTTGSSWCLQTGAVTTTKIGVAGNGPAASSWWNCYSDGIKSYTGSWCQSYYTEATRSQ